MAYQEQKDEEKGRHHHEQVFGLKARLEQLAQEQAVVTAEHQVARLSGQRLHEAELHVQAKAAELNYKEA